VSAGVFAWLGWCAGAALKAPERFPRGFAVTALGFAFLNAAIGAAANPEASNIGHGAGLVLGLVWGLAAPSPGAKTCRRSRS
jgi:membrane associated rhomboid family serine protease